MLIAHYIGDHKNDTLLVRAGWYLTRLVQKGEYKHVTHCEAIHREHSDGSVTIASSSLRDNGVRSKRVKLNPAHWMIVDVPQWDVRQSIKFFKEHDDVLYDIRGALATVLPGREDSSRMFCNESVGASVGLKTPHCFQPAQFAAISLSIGYDVTENFFKSRK